MAVVENHARAARQALPDAGEPAHQEHRNAGLDRELVERIPDWIAGREAEAILALAEAKEAGPARREPLELAEPEILHGWVGGEPVAVDDVAVVARELDHVVVRRADLVRIGHPPGAIDVENGAHVALTKAVGHLRLGLERALALEHALRVLVFLHRAVMQPGLGAEVRMAVEIAHGRPVRTL